MPKCKKCDYPYANPDKECPNCGYEPPTVQIGSSSWLPSPWLLKIIGIGIGLYILLIIVSVIIGFFNSLFS